jgi:hypothetical protein
MPHAPRIWRRMSNGGETMRPTIVSGAETLNDITVYDLKIGPGTS